MSGIVVEALNSCSIQKVGLQMGLKRQLIRALSSRRAYYTDLQEYLRLSGESTRFIYKKKNSIRILDDRFQQAGKVDIHYFLQDIYMAKKIINGNVRQLYDIGSRVDGFISHLLAAGVEVTMIDIRPLEVAVDGLSFVRGDATTLDGILDNSIMHLSSLHAVEHFGLGRYGDRIDHEGWYKALRAMANKLSVGGTLYLSVPIGIEEKVCFNAHRIFSPQTIVETLGDLQLELFSYIHDYTIIETDIDEFVKNGGTYDCGMFIFRKIKSTNEAAR